MVWGGVTKNGGHLDLSVNADAINVYVFGAASVLLGQLVVDNWQAEGGVGIGWRPHEWGGTSFATGLDVGTMLFGENLSHFTFGHGGYFSPQAFVSVGLPLRFTRSEGALTYRAQASRGMVWLHEEDAPYYPIAPGRQAIRAGLVSEDDAPVESFHKSHDGFGYAFSLDGTLAYEVRRGLKLGLVLRIHTGRDFQEYTGGAMLSYTLQQGAAEPSERKSPVGGE